jgi:hypothetical protein
LWRKLGKSTLIVGALHSWSLKNVLTDEKKILTLFLQDKTFADLHEVLFGLKLDGLNMLLINTRNNVLEYLKKPQPFGCSTQRA